MFKMHMDTLQGTSDKNGRGKDSNTNENMDNVLSKDEYLNDQIFFLKCQDRMLKLK